MSHNVQQNDRIIATESTWHGLETIVPEVTFGNSGLDWDVTQGPVFDADMQPIPGFKVLGTDRGPITVAKDSYQIIQNSRVWEALERALVGVNYRVTCAGSLGNRAKMFVSVDLDGDQEHVVNGDAFRSRMAFFTAHDGSMSLQAWDCHTRIVCQNTLNAALSERGGKVRLAVRHTRNAETRITGMEQAIEAAFEKRAEFYTSLEYLQTVEVDRPALTELLAGHVVERPEASQRIRNRANRIGHLFYRGTGNKGQTAYDLFNAVTEYWTREAVQSDAGKNYASSEFGGGAKAKADALAMLRDAGRREATREHGRRVLAALAAA